MTDQPFSFALHIGAHKTATSHLQRSLQKAANVLAVKGVRYYGPTHFRQPQPNIPNRFGLARRQKHAADRVAPTAQLAELRKDGHRVLLSEENYIGALNHPKGRAVKKRYKDAHSRIAALAEAIGQDVDVFLSVRRPTNFINSAYCQMLLSGQYLPIETFQRRNALSTVDWHELVMRLRSAKGVGQLTVWAYEDYATVFPQITAQMVGPEHAHLVVPASQRVNVGLSQAAVTQASADIQEGVLDHAGRLARKALPVGPDYPPFDGFLAETHAISELAYRRQLAAIAQMDGVNLLQPSTA